jgi:hypothetical protein
VNTSTIMQFTGMSEEKSVHNTIEPCCVSWVPWIPSLCTIIISLPSIVAHKLWKREAAYSERYHEQIPIVVYMLLLHGGIRRWKVTECRNVVALFHTATKCRLKDRLRKRPSKSQRDVNFWGRKRLEKLHNVAGKFSPSFTFHLETLSLFIDSWPRN